MLWYSKGDCSAAEQTSAHDFQSLLTENVPEAKVKRITVVQL